MPRWLPRGAVVVSQYLGSRDRANADLAASQIFHINAVLSAVCMAVMLLLENAVLSGLYGSMGKTRTAMYVSIAMNLLNMAVTGGLSGNL